MIEVFMLYLIIPKRLNFLQMSRYSTYGEQRFRQQFEKKFDFMSFNTELTTRFFGSRKAIAFDPSYISKSGNKTPYLGRFWSGCAGAVKKGLELSGIAAIDIDLHQCLHLEAIQTAPVQTLGVVSMTLSNGMRRLYVIEQKSCKRFHPLWWQMPISLKKNL